MIVDVISNLYLYESILPNLDKAADFIQKYNRYPLETGKYTLDGDKAFAVVQEYETVGSYSVKWESHELYIDIQYIAKGNEKILWNHAENLMVSEPYDEIKDVTLYEGPQYGEINMTEGMFAIFFPDDCHKPKCISEKSEKVNKIVIKLHL